MTTIRVDVDLDEFDNDDVVEAALEYLKEDAYLYHKNEDEIKEVIDKYNNTLPSGRVRTIHDDMFDELFEEIREKYNIHEFKRLLERIENGQN